VISSTVPEEPDPLLIGSVPNVSQLLPQWDLDLLPKERPLRKTIVSLKKLSTGNTMCMWKLGDLSKMTLKRRPSEY